MTARLANIIDFYRQGFKSMRLGRLLWEIILFKLILLYALAKFWFPDYLRTHYATDQARADHVLNELTRTPSKQAGAKVPLPQLQTTEETGRNLPPRHE